MKKLTKDILSKLMAENYVIKHNSYVEVFAKDGSGVIVSWVNPETLKYLPLDKFEEYSLIENKLYKSIYNEIHKNESAEQKEKRINDYLSEIPQQVRDEFKRTCLN